MSFLEKAGGKRKEYLLRSIRFTHSYGAGFLLFSKFVPGSSRHRKHVGVKILAHERAEPGFLGHQCRLAGLFRNSIFRDTAASILRLRSSRL
jgi:hypothetical protein